MLLGLVGGSITKCDKYGDVDYKQIPYRHDIEDLMTFDALIVLMEDVLAGTKNYTISTQFANNLACFRDEKIPVLIILPSSNETLFSYRKTDGALYNNQDVTSFLNSVYPGINIKYKKYTQFVEQQINMKSINVSTTHYTFENILSLGSARKTNEIVFGFSEKYNVLFAPFVTSYEIFFKLFSFFDQSKPIEKTPDWINSTFILDEIDIMKEIEVTNNQISCLTNELAKFESVLNYYFKLKSIIFTSGDYLQDTVVQILKNEFKFDIISNRVDNECDIVVKFEDRYLVIEVKGVRGSITSKHVMQATKWTTEFILKNIEAEPDIDKRVKTSLIGNPMKDLPAESRVDEFPEDTIRIASSNNVSMIRTITLLRLFQDLRLGKLSNEHFFNVLYDKKALIEYNQFG